MDMPQAPEAVRAEGERARKLVEELAAQKAGDAGKTGEEAPPEQAPEGTDFNEQPARAEEQPAEKPKEDFEHKYRVLQNKYDAEVPLMTREIRALKAEIEALKAAPPKQEQKEEENRPSHQKLNPAALEDYGEDMVRMAESVNLLADEIERLRSENAELKRQVEPMRQDAKLSAQDRFLTQLGQQVPWYEEQNVDPEFMSWLAQPDPLDPEDRSRQDRLTEAAQKGNARVAAAYFLTWNQQTGRYGTQAAPAAEPPRRAPANIQPSVSRASEAPAGKKSWTAAEVDKFYRDVREGKYAGQDAKVMSIKQDIAAASREGRLLR